MKNYKFNFIRVIVLCSLLVSTSCMDSWTEMNINPNQPSVVPATTIFGSGMTVMAGQLFGERIGIYYTGTWSGQLAAIGAGDYEFRVDIKRDCWCTLVKTVSELFLNSSCTRTI